MNILGVWETKVLNFKSARSLPSTLFVHATRALLCEGWLKFGGVGIYDSEGRQMFSDLSQISTVLYHNFYVRVS
jgi:hypothetical protein